MMNNLAFLRTLIHGLVVLLVASQLVFAQKVVDRSSSELPPWTTEPPVGKYFTYYSGVGSSPNSLSDAKEQSIANVLSEIIMEGEITAESRIETFHQQSKEGIISEVSREIQQTGASTTIGGFRKEEEYWQTVKTGDGLLYQYWILMKIPKPEYAGFDLSVKQGYGIAPIWRSALVPGWGQFNKGEKKKGLRLLGSEAALASTFFICQQISRDYSRKASDERDVDRRKFYNDWANRSYSISMISGIMAGVVYCYNVFDAVTARGAKKYAYQPVIYMKGEFPAPTLCLAINF